MVAACVVGMPWGKSLYVFRVPFFKSFAARGPAADVRDDLVVFAVHDEHGNGDLLEIFREVGLRERDDAVVVCVGAAHHALPPPVLNGRLRGLRTGPVEAVEGTNRQVAIELRND